MDALQLPEDLNAAYFLQLLVHHDWDDFSPALKEQARKTLEPDEHGTINLNVKTKSFTILLKGGKLANASTWTYEAPHTVFHDLHNAPGILFTAPQGALPSGKNGFWIQQFHGKDHHVGRTIIEFWTNNVLTALFKTDVGNFGASGEGVWTVRP